MMTTFFESKRLIHGAAFLGALTLLSALAFFASPLATHAASCTFASAGTDDWQTAANWSCAVVPGAGDEVTIPAATSTTLSAAVEVSTLDVGAGSTIDPNGNGFSVTSTATNAGTINNNGTLQFFATTTNSGTIGSSSTEQIIFYDDIINSGTLSPGPAVLILIGLWDNTGGTLVSSGFVSFQQGRDQIVPPEITVGTLEILKFSPATARVTLSGNVTSTNSMVFTSGVFDLDGNTFYSRRWDNSGGTLEANLGTVEIIGSGSAVFIDPEPNFYNLRINADLSSELKSLGGNISVSGTLEVVNGILGAGSGNYSITLSRSGTGGIRPFIATPAQFNPTAGTVIYAASSTTDVEPVVYYGLQLDEVGAYNLTASTTALGTTTVASTATFAVGTNDFTALGTITNTGLITINVAGGGSIIHANEDHRFTDSASVTVTTVTVGGRFYVTLQDSNLNLDGTTIETVTVTVSGSDSETITLTETGVATGIFRNTDGIEIIQSFSSTAGNGRIEISADTTLTSTYTDPYDGTETDLATVSASATATASPTPASSSGKGGQGSGIPTPVTTYQEFLPGAEWTLPAPMHALVKLPDDGNALTQADSAVYYIGSDGMRHAFPNHKVYFTWYDGFSEVQIISGDVLAEIPLGANVTYKPGVKMVKFTTDPKVYAVEKGGLLRWITTEAVAIALFGSDWNTKIDDISDAFYSNYRFGSSIGSTADYNPAAAEASVTFPSDSLQQ